MHTLPTPHIVIAAHRLKGRAWPRAHTAEGISIVTCRREMFDVGARDHAYNQNLQPPMVPEGSPSALSLAMHD